MSAYETFFKNEKEGTKIKSSVLRVVKFNEDFKKAAVKWFGTHSLKDI